MPPNIELVQSASVPVLTRKSTTSFDMPSNWLISPCARALSSVIIGPKNTKVMMIKVSRAAICGMNLAYLDGSDAVAAGLAALVLISGLVFAMFFWIDTSKNKIYCLMDCVEIGKSGNRVVGEEYTGRCPALFL